MSTSRPMSNNNNNNNDAPSPLSNDVMKDARREEIYPRLPLSALGLLAQTSKQYKAETAFLQLLQASIHAAPAFLDAEKDPTALAAIAILKEHLKEHPEFLFTKKMVRDHYGREIWASPYQIFLGAGDIWALRQIQKDILPLIENGEAQAEAQFKEQFPHYPWPLPKDFSEAMLYDDRNKRQIKEIVEQLAIVKQCIDADPFTNEKPNDTTKYAVETLCKLFQPKPGEIIRSGLHFPLAIMKEIYETYNALQDHWAFFTLAVIKPALDALSTIDGQCCQGGLRDLDMEKGPNRRCDSSYRHSLGKPLSLTLVNDKDKRGRAAVVDPYSGDVLFGPSSGLGYFDCFNKIGAWGWAGASVVCAMDEVGVQFGKFMENKSRSIWELLCGCAQRNQHSVSMIINQ